MSGRGWVVVSVLWAVAAMSAGFFAESLMPLGDWRWILVTAMALVGIVVVWRWPSKSDVKPRKNEPAATDPEWETTHHCKCVRPPGRWTNEPLWSHGPMSSAFTQPAMLPCSTTGGEPYDTRRVDLRGRGWFAEVSYDVGW